jgi:hypothetical protein
LPYRICISLEFFHTSHDYLRSTHAHIHTHKYSYYHATERTTTALPLRTRQPPADQTTAQHSVSTPTGVQPTYEIQAVSTKALLSRIQKLLSIKSIQKICVYSSSFSSVCFPYPCRLLLLNYRRHISGEISFKLFKHVFFGWKPDWFVSQSQYVFTEERQSCTTRYKRIKSSYQFRFWIWILKYQMQLLYHKDWDSYYLHTRLSCEILTLDVAEIYEIRTNKTHIYVITIFLYISTHINSRGKGGTGRPKRRQTLPFTLWTSKQALKKQVLVKDKKEKNSVF